VACYFLCVALIFLRVPWTGNVGYSWFWSRPQLRAITGIDVVAVARQRWERDYNANTIHEKRSRSVQRARPHDKDKRRREAKGAIEIARLRRSELSHKRKMSDQDVLVWLNEEDNFDRTFPEMSNLGASGRMELFDEWKQVVAPTKEWNERVLSANMDYRRIGWELIILTASCAVGVFLSPRKSL
jgi:hypothetical protein